MEEVEEVEDVEEATFAVRTWMKCGGISPLAGFAWQTRLDHVQSIRIRLLRAVAVASMVDQTEPFHGRKLGTNSCSLSFSTNKMM